MFQSCLQSRGGRVAAAVTSGAVVRAMSSVVSLVSLPLAVRYLGPERFGIWATIASSAVFLNLLDLGVASTLTNCIARSHTVGCRDEAARYVTNALALSVAVSATAALVSATAWQHLDWMTLFHVSGAARRAEVDGTVVVALGLILASLPATLAGRIFAGYQEVHLSNAIVGAGTAANLAGLGIGVAWRVPMPVLFLLATGWTTVANLAALAGILYWRKPWLRPRVSYLQWNISRELLKSGSGFFLIQAAGAIVFCSDNIVLSHFLGPAQVTPYSVTWRLVGLTTIMQALLFPALWPAYADAYARGEHAWLRRAFRRTMQSTLALNSAFALALVAIGRPLIHIWAGSAAVPPRSLLAAMAVWSVISGAMTVESCLLAAVNRTREQGVLSIAAAALNLVLSIVLVQHIGAVGAILGTLLSYLLVLVVPQTLMVRRVLGESGPRPPELRLRHQPVAG